MAVKGGLGDERKEKIKYIKKILGGGEKRRKKSGS